MTLGIAQVDPLSPFSDLRGLEVSKDYFWNQDNEDTTDAIFVSTDCHDDDSDAVDVYMEAEVGFAASELCGMYGCS